MRGHSDALSRFRFDRAGLALLLATVMFAGSLVSALSAAAATNDQPGNPGTSNSASHGKPSNAGNESNGNEGNSEGKSNGNSEGKSNGNSEGKSNGNSGGKGNSKNNSQGNDKSDDRGNSDDARDKDKDNGKGKGGKGKGGKKDEEEPDVDEEPAEPDQVLGARLVGTRLLLSYKRRAFRGKVLARRDRCVRGRTVTVKRRNGTVIGRDKTNKRGVFSIRAPKRAGRFKARVGRKTFIREAADIKVVCLSDKARLRIKAL